MANLGDLIFKVGVTGLPGFEQGFRDITTTITKSVNDSEKAFRGLDKMAGQLSKTGLAMSTAITLPLAGIGAASLKMAGDFEHSLAKIAAFGDITGAPLERLRQQALQLGKDTQFSAQQAADAMAVFASAGLNADQIYAAMPGTLRLAAAGQLAVADAATITKDVLGEFQLTAADSGHVADVLAQASADASASLGEMANTLTYAGPVAKGAGQSLEETTAAIIALDAAGIRGEKAGTGLRGVLASLLAPSKEAAGFIKDLGVNISDTSGHILPLSDIMEQFKQKLGNVSTEAEKQNVIFQVFGREAGNAAQVLINTGGPALDQWEQKLVNSTGAADRMAKLLNSGLNFALEQLGGSVETAGIALGTTLIPIAKQALGVLTNVLNDAVIPAIQWFDKLPDPIKTATIGLLGLAAATGPVIFGAGQMLGAISNISKSVLSMGDLVSKLAGTQLTGLTAALGSAGAVALPVAAGIAAIGASIALLKFSGVTDEFSKMWEAIQRNKAALGELVSGIGSVFSDITTRLRETGAAIGQFLPEIQLIGLAWDQVKKVFSSFSLSQFIGDAIPVLGILRSGIEATTIAVEFLGGRYKSMDEAVAAQAARAKEFAAAQTHSMAEAAGGFDLVAHAVAAVKKEQVDANKELDLAQKAYNQLVKLAKQGAASQDDVAAALKKVQLAAAKAHPELTATGVALKQNTKAVTEHQRVVKILEDTLNKQEDALRDVKRAYELGLVPIEDVRKAEEKIKDIFQALHPEFTRHAAVTQDLTAVYDKFQKEMGDLTVTVTHLPGVMEALADKITSLKSPAEQLSDAFHQLGITSSADLKKTADAAQEAYDRIVTDSNATEHDVAEAWKKMTEAQAAYLRSIGNEQGARALEDALNAQVGVHQATATKVSGIWEHNVQQISTAFTDFAKTITDDLLNGDLSIGGALEQLSKTLLRVFVEDGLSYVNQFIEKGLKSVLGHLGDILDKIPGIGDALSSVLGKISGPAPSIATPPISTTSGIPGGGAAGSAAGAGSSAAGAAVSGLTGIIGAVGSIGTLITGIIGNFQNARQENTLNAIELNTRVAAFYLAGDNSGGGILHQVYLTNELLSWGPLVKATEKIRDLLNDNLGRLSPLDLMPDVRQLLRDISTNIYLTWGQIVDHIVPALSTATDLLAATRGIGSMLADGTGTVHVAELAAALTAGIDTAVIPSVNVSGATAAQQQITVNVAPTIIVKTYLDARQIGEALHQGYEDMGIRP